jgi:hypothetical protein
VKHPRIEMGIATVSATPPTYNIAKFFNNNKIPRHRTKQSISSTIFPSK